MLFRPLPRGGGLNSEVGVVELHQGDCLEIMKELSAASVSLIIADPPYYKVKNEAWDRQWAKPAEFLDWIGYLCREWHRILKPNGSLYCFASPQMSARVECKIAETFSVLNRIVWAKNDGTHNKGGSWSRTCKAQMRAYFPQSEYLIFAEHYGADSMALGKSGYAAQCEKLRGFVFEPLRVYLRDEWERAGLTPDDANIACGTASMAGRHYFTRSQWCLPTAEHYTSLQRYANRTLASPEYLRREYEDLRREYEDLRREYEDLRREYEDLRRPFSVSADVPYTDVWDFPTVAHFKGKHPCEKPLALIEHIVSVSSRPGDTVLDPFLGSGVTGEACRNLGREFIGIERDDHYFQRAKARIDSASPSLYAPHAKRIEQAHRSTPLFSEAACSPSP